MKTAFTIETIVTRLREARPALEAKGCLHLALFGSVARGDNKPESDIDFAAVYDKERVRDLFDRGGVAGAIEEAIQTNHFDLADEENLRAPVKERFDREHVRIF